VTTSESARHYGYMLTAYSTDCQRLDVSAYFTEPHVTDGFTINFESGRDAAAAIGRVKSGTRGDGSTGKRMVAYVVLWLRWDDAVAAIPEVYVTASGRRVGVVPHIVGRVLTDDALTARTT